MESSTIDLWPILEPVLVALGVALSTVLTWGVGRILSRLGQKFDIELDAGHRETLERAINRAVEFGTDKVRESVSTKTRFETRSQIVATAFGYLAPKVPDALKRFGIDVNSVEGRAALADLIESRLPGYQVEMATGRALSEQEFDGTFGSGPEGPYSPAPDATVDNVR